MTIRVNTTVDEKESARQGHVLETALTVFVRHGFRKTSIKDISKAAGISRQGIYLHFKDKDAIFSASIQKTLDDGLQAASRILDDDRLTLEEKLANALGEWFGRHVGLFGPDASDLLAQCERVLGDAVGKKPLFVSKETRESHPGAVCEEDKER
jgi:TetR/AcrR family transcriptional regulator, regulator of autoinduction and epiphytic fitness